MTIVPEDDPRLFFTSTEKAITPPAGLIEHLKDRWWVVHPTKGLVFWDKHHMAPQCNSNEAVARRIWEQMYPWAEIKFIPSVYRSINPQDYVS